MTDSLRMLTEQEALAVVKALDDAIAEAVAERDALNKRIAELRLKHRQARRVANAFRPRRRKPRLIVEAPNG